VHDLPNHAPCIAVRLLQSAHLIDQVPLSKGVP
jgi:hypothetical protein